MTKNLYFRTTPAHSESAKDNTSPSVTDDKVDTAPGESQNNESKMHYTESSAEVEIDFTNSLEGQMNIFNLM